MTLGHKHDCLPTIYIIVVLIIIIKNRKKTTVLAGRLKTAVSSEVSPRGF